ncbi:MAG: hypothetical protein H7A23_24685 [Leptospiraceae bacterium]|nr:hypothetical protein [Leptospiraceae bacterium]MCP5497763.1 hypothetical protein [Leptospiraceae bacterium]
MSKNEKIPNKKLYAFLLLIISSGSTALIVAGNAGEVRLPESVGVMIALIGGGLGAFFMGDTKERGWFRVIIGITFAYGVFKSVLTYAEWRGKNIFEIELILPILVGAIPALILYKFLTR